MLDWINNSHADYVLAAYGIAVLALAGIGASSWLTAKRTRKAWRNYQTKD